MRISDWSSDVCSADRAAAGLTATACGLTGTTPPSTFYLLSPIATPAPPSANPNRQITILIGPVTLPKHLDRAEVVTFATPNRLQLAELDRWAEPLDENVARVLGENVSRLVPRSEEHTSELQSLMRISYAVFCLKKKTNTSYYIH